jgi:hypothetical protein
MREWKISQQTISSLAATSLNRPTRWYRDIESLTVGKAFASLVSEQTFYVKRTRAASRTGRALKGKHGK